jgi:hypothetical protein
VAAVATSVRRLAAAAVTTAAVAVGASIGEAFGGPFEVQAVARDFLIDGEENGMAFFPFHANQIVDGAGDVGLLVSRPFVGDTGDKRKKTAFRHVVSADPHQAEVGNRHDRSSVPRHFLAWEDYVSDQVLTAPAFDAGPLAEALGLGSKINLWTDSNEPAIRGYSRGWSLAVVLQGELNAYADHAQGGAESDSETRLDGDPWPLVKSADLVGLDADFGSLERGHGSLLGFVDGIPGRLRGNARVDQSPPDQQYTDSSQNELAESPSRHILLSRQVATVSALQFIGGVALIFFGYWIVGRGADWSADTGFCLVKRTAGGIVLAAGTAIAVTGALVAADSGLLG